MGLLAVEAGVVKGYLEPQVGRTEVWYLVDRSGRGHVRVIK